MYKQQKYSSITQEVKLENGGTVKNTIVNPPHTPIPNTGTKYVVYFITSHSYDCVLNDCYTCRFNGCMKYGDETRVVATQAQLEWLKSKKRVKIMSIIEVK